MTPHVLDLIATAFATIAIVDVWFNGSIFAEARSTVQSWPADNPVTGKPASRLRVTLAELLGCPLCLNTQVAIWLNVLLWLFSHAPGPIFGGVRMTVHAFAAAGAAWMLNERRPRGGYERKGST